MRIGNVLRLELVSGEPLVRQGVRVTPQARLFSLRLPFWSYVWNHPESLLVERGTTRETRMIPDVTMLSQFVIGAALLIIPVLFFAGLKGARK